MRAILFGLFVLGTGLTQAVEPGTNQFLASIPEGYYLQAYDDCGVADRQPHVLMKDCYLWTFNTSDTDAGLKERSAVFSYKGIQAVYENLDPRLSYVLALTYASDHVYNRVQSLEANGVVLHGPFALPKAKATRRIVRVPPEAIREGKMSLSWKIHGEVNATVSIIELWANAATTNGLKITSLAGLPGSLQGQVLDQAYDAVSGAQVSLSAPGTAAAATAKTGAEGVFSFPRKAVDALGAKGELTLTASKGAEQGRAYFSTQNLFFDPVHYRPLPEKIAGLDHNCLLLDGAWVIDPAPAADARMRALGNKSWRPFRVPGQWRQQGFDIPQDRPVAVAREFWIPRSWAGRRIFLRFDAVHAGTRYWLNGRQLGYSENLFTPIEWDITESAQVGRTNRLDLEMKVATVSEAMSYSSAYAFHNLGGIDRSVRIFALPPTYLRELHLNAGLDKNHRDGELRLRIVLDSGPTPQEDLSLALRLSDPAGRAVKLATPAVKIAPFTGTTLVDQDLAVSSPLQWSAEKPHLYRLDLELRQGRVALEHIARSVGFRSVEIRGSQLYINGRRLKIAGACHHEFDPLSGRANTARHAETDVRLLKEANLNWIRTSHYPPTAELLEVADRLGMYVEVEAPFCWVGGALDNPTNLNAMLTPTSAMVDYHHSHPSVIIWSVANESHFNLQFQASSRMLKDLDPTRPTTFNHDFANSPSALVTDIANVHYPSWPFEKVFEGDKRPLYFGEYFFPICHEQTDVNINPGLRELWGQGQAEPESEFAKACAKDLAKPPLKPGLMPGAWSHIYHSDRIAGGSIWASHDDAFYFSETNHAGYAWHHGFWGLIDYWRRPKPEWWFCRHIFSPVWLEAREAGFTPGMKMIRLPVENRYAFTDLSELKFRWEINGHKGTIKPRLAPGERGELEIPVPSSTVEGDEMLLRISGPSGGLISESRVRLGKKKPAVLPQPSSDLPSWSEDGTKIIVQGRGFGVVFDRLRGDFDPADPRHTCAVASFPAVHVTRYDFGDLNGPNSPPYAVFPDAKTRRLERIEIKEESAGLRLTVHDRYDHFAGSTSWLLDKAGCGVVACDYTYSGPTMDTREAGVRFLVRPACDELKWRRWSEWGVFPQESISRTEGSARAHRDRKLGSVRWNERPTWPWSLDETELGTADFRSVKYNIYQAGLLARDGSGFTTYARGGRHFRAALARDGVAAHLLWRCPLGQVALKAGDRLQGEFVVRLQARR